LLGFIGPLFRIWNNFTLFGLIFVFNYFLGIWVKHFWSLDINIQLKRVATSFPHHFHVSRVNGSTFEAHSGIFVILQLIMAVL